MRCLALDIGGSSGRLLLCEYKNGKLALDTLHRFGNEPVELGGHLYWDFLMLWSEVKKGLKKAAGSGVSIDSMGIDAFCNDYSFVDGNGALMSPVFSYRDNRTVENRERIFSVLSAHELYMRNGNQIAPFNTLMQLACLSFEETPFFDPERYTFLFLPDLIAYYLTGTKTIEYTLLSVSEFFDYKAGALDKDILKRFGIPEAIFPPVVFPGYNRGGLLPELAELKPFRNTELIAVCEHDTASAFLGSATDEPQFILSGGTWALIGLETDAPVISEDGFRYNIANEGSVPGHHRILRNVMGNWLFQQLIADYRTEGIEYRYSDLIALAEEVPPCAALIDVDHEDFYGPGNMRKKIRMHAVTKDGRPVADDAAVYARCIYDSLALKYRWCIEKLTEVTGEIRNVINIIGGAAQDELQCRLLADVCGKKVVAGPVEATALGNVLVQLLAKGAITTVEEGRRAIRDSFDFVIYEPDKSDSRWDERYERFLKIFSL